MTKNKLTKYLSYTVVLLLFMPFMQSILYLVAERQLGGSYPKPNNPAFSMETWWNGGFQKSKEWYLKNSFGFRKPLLRFRYQMMYDMYSMSRVHGFLVGKDGYLFQHVYSNADRGLNFIGESKIDSMVRKIKMVQQKMEEEGKHLFVVVAPSKTRYYKEYLPDHCIPDPDAKTNYEEYVKRFKENGIPHMDMSTWFGAMRDTTKFPLYPKTGIHYSTYGAAMVADSMVKYWEKTFAKDISDFYWDEVEWTTWLRDEERDLEWAMNLMYPIPNTKMAYPIIKINEKGKFKPNVLTVGDSYFWRFYHWGGPEKIYNKSKFLYYNREIYPGKAKREKYNLAKELKKLDAICIFTNPSAFSVFSWGIIDDLYEHYYGVSDKEILELVERIKKNPKWYNNIVKKAVDFALPLDSMLYIDAQYTLRVSNQNKKYKKVKAANPKIKAEIEKVKAIIKAKPKWYASVKEKAAKRKITVDSMLFLDARYYVIKQEEKKKKK